MFLFPLLLAFGVAVLSARLLIVALSRRRRGDTGRVSAWYLAVRRLASSSRLAVLFLVAASLALAVFTASQAMVRSIHGTVEAKAKVFVGSDVQLQIGPDTVVPPNLGYPRHDRDAVSAGGASSRTASSQFDLLAIDPEHVRAGGVLERRLLRSIGLRSDGPVARYVGRPSSRGRWPTGRASRPPTLEIQQQVVPIEIVAETSSVPGDVVGASGVRGLRPGVAGGVRRTRATR